MAALIKFSLNACWTPGVDASLSKGREKHAILTDEAEARSPYRSFDFGFKVIRFELEEVRNEFWLTTNHRTIVDILPVVGRWGCSAEFKHIV
ncbi:hypothetical protein [Roseomonas rosulenta]|uniref:hypothetical protein n=1 Tax=Roseomonas rosulenta TaxID=2748667 RepID=UPI0018DF8F5F|nr:hypothetical protein [Roseomonas rosulenta]